MVSKKTLNHKQIGTNALSNEDESPQDSVYFYELYTGLPRGGPGDNASTRKAFNYITNLPDHPLILDIGCGPGMQTIELAKLSNGTIIALDNYQPFLDQLIKNANQQGVQNHIIPKLQSMDNMDFDKEYFDLIWSEGALYFLGFSKGLQSCHTLLKPNRHLAVTEAVYLKPNPPKPVIEFWEPEYPYIKDINHNIELIEKNCFDLISHFTLPTSSWLKDFYNPMEKKIKILKEKYEHNKRALQIFNTAQKEIEIFKKYSDYFGYEFFIMKKNQ